MKALSGGSEPSRIDPNVLQADDRTMLEPGAGLAPPNETKYGGVSTTQVTPLNPVRTIRCEEKAKC